eukprot:TRINITY_DN29088_c0_g1_i1.p1 TRINITY_DN29088_c0_g1~~TRINITY_DN29088_c0_g1_i1.p1  ORF type:complete len:440 (-),score=67.51 TRINITY_DN29088_c0_g1_i1:458-1735(-)
MCGKTAVLCLVSVRGAVALLATLAVLTTSGAVCALVLTSSAKSRASLSRDAQQAVDTLANTMVAQSLDQAANPLRDYFQSVVEIANNQMLFLQTLNITSVIDPAVRKLIALRARQLLTTYHNAATASTMATDGSAVLMTTSPLRLWMEFTPGQEGIPEGQYVFWTDPFSEFVGPFLSLAMDIRTTPGYTFALTLPPNTVGWAPLTVANDIYFSAGSAVRPPGSAAGSPALHNIVGSTTAWLSTMLQGLANKTGSVMLLVTRDGTLVGTSHGSAVLPVKDSINALAINATQSPLAIVRETAIACLPDEETLRASDKKTEFNKETVYRRTVEILELGTSLCAAQRIRDSLGLDLVFVVGTPRAYFFGSLEANRRVEERRAEANARVTIVICAGVLVAAAVVRAGGSATHQATARDRPDNGEGWRSPA